MGNLSAQGVPQSRPMPKEGSGRQLKPLVAGKPNPNIGRGLKTPGDLPQFGESGWVNPNYDPYHNADGYHRFDPTIPGMGIQLSRTYADGARTYDSYQQINQGTPGYTHAKNASQFMVENGINPARANDIQKYAAMDYAMRLVQWKNQRPKRKFGIKDAFGLALSVAAIFSGNPYVAAGLAASGTAVRGGDFKDILLSAGAAGLTHGSPGFNVATAAKLGAAGYQSLASSGVNLSSDQYSIRQGGNPAITTFEQENRNIALSPHPSSAYAAAYPGASNVANSVVSPINTAPIAPINRTMNAARPYVAPPRIQIAPNRPIIKYDPRRNYPPTMQQALMRPAATRSPA